MTNKSFKLGVLVSGRGSNLQAIIDRIEDGTLPAALAVVISNKREAPALERAGKHGIETVFIDPKAHGNREEYDRAVAAELNNRQVDLVCLAGYMRILSPFFIQAFERRIINIHPSLLPAFPGLDVQQQAIDHGVRFSGCTVHFVDEGVDTGPIILQAAVPVHNDDTADSLAERILKEEHRLYPKAIQLIAEDRIRIEGRRVLIKEA